MGDIINIKEMTDAQLKNAHDHIHSEIFINYQRIKQSQAYYLSGIETGLKTNKDINRAKNEIKRYANKLMILECETIRRSVFHE